MILFSANFAIDMFQQEFQRTIQQAGAAEEKIEALLSAIAEQYSAPERWYHNLSHLEQIMLQLLAVKDRIQNWTAVVLATAYHDYVYDPLRTDNEEESAVRAEHDLSEVVDANCLALCLRMIRATKTHTHDADEDVNFFIDADLSILGAAAPEYLTYTRQIRKEYQQFADPVYRAGRITVIQRFLQRERIFSTSWFFKMYEAAARRNLQSELAEWDRPDRGQTKFS